jgi:hypothetical protein
MPCSVRNLQSDRHESRQARTVSMRVAWAALAMLAANRYLARPGSFKPYHVAWDAGHARVRARG